MKMIDEAKARKIIRGMPVSKSLDNGFAAEGWSEELPRVYRQTAKLLNEYGDISKAQRTHMEQMLHLCCGLRTVWLPGIDPICLPRGRYYIRQSASQSGMG